MYQFDYTNQAWIKDGRYVRCGHSNCVVEAKGRVELHCEWDSYRKIYEQSCFGTRHIGERPNLTAEVR